MRAFFFVIRQRSVDDVIAHTRPELRFDAGSTPYLVELGKVGGIPPNMKWWWYDAQCGNPISACGSPKLTSGVKHREKSPCLPTIAMSFLKLIKINVGLKCWNIRCSAYGSSDKERTEATNDQYLFFFLCNADSINTHLFVTQSHGPFPGTFIFQQTISRSKEPYLRSFFL